MKKKERQEELVKAKDFQGFFDELSQETDRGAALLAGALLDNYLATLLEAFFIEDVPTKKGGLSEVEKLLYEPNAPLASFSSRTRAAYCLGLISAEDLSDIGLIREIRNQFAHRVHGISFKTSAINSLCRRFSTVDRLNLHFAQSARERFISTAAIYASQLAVSSLTIAAKDKRKARNPTVIHIVSV